jgi:hypothetical protein
MEGLMRPTSIANDGATPRAARLLGAQVRVGIAMIISLAGATAHISPLGAEPTATDLQTSEPQQVGASNGGVASATTGGDVEIGQIITGENTGNSIATGDISGPAEISGGEIDYPTDVTVSLMLGPPIATADGGDEGTASTSDDDSQSEGDVNKDTGKDGEDITIINRNDNRSEAKAVDRSRD